MDSRISSLGGKALFNKYGREYMSEIGKRGAQAFYRKYKLVPYGTNQFAIVDRSTERIIKVKNG